MFIRLLVCVSRQKQKQAELSPLSPSRSSARRVVAWRQVCAKVAVAHCGVRSFQFGVGLSSLVATAASRPGAQLYYPLPGPLRLPLGSRLCH